MDPGSDPVLYDVRLLLGPLLSSSSSSSSSGNDGGRGHSNANSNVKSNVNGNISGDGDGDIGGVDESKSSDAPPIEVMVQGVIREEYEYESKNISDHRTSSSQAIAGSKSSHNVSILKECFVCSFFVSIF